MRIWMLGSLFYAVTAIGGDRGIELSSRFFGRVVATSQQSNLFDEFQQSERATRGKCCTICSRGKPTDYVDAFHCISAS